MRYIIKRECHFESSDKFVNSYCNDEVGLIELRTICQIFILSIECYCYMHIAYGQPNAIHCVQWMHSYRFTALYSLLCGDVCVCDAANRTKRS